MFCHLVNDIYVEIAKYLPLNALSAWASTCKQFNQVVHDPHLLKTSLKPSDFKAANAAFFLKHFHLASTSALLAFNFRLISRDQLGEIPETDENRVSLRVAKLMTSLLLLEKAILEKPENYLPKRCLKLEEWKIFEKQQPYRHLLEITQKPNTYIEMFSKDARTRANFSLINEKELMEDVKKKKTYKIASFVIFYDYIQLRRQNSVILQDVFTYVWNQYKIEHLYHPFYDEQCFPLEVFQGLCQALRAQKVVLDLINNFIIDDERLKALLPVLKDQKIKQLRITIRGYVQPIRFIELAELLLSDEFVKLNKDASIGINFSLLQKEDNNVNSSLKETKKIFWDFKNKVRQKKLPWRAKWMKGNL